MSTEDLHNPSAQTLKRNFRVIAAERERAANRACKFCNADRVECRVCEAAGLVPNAYEFTHQSEQHFHHGTCYRHGPVARRCPHTPDLAGIGDGDGVSRARLYTIVSAFTAAALFVGLLLGLVLLPIIARVVAH